MAVSPTPPPITLLPAPPLPTDPEAVFDTKAGVSLTAQVAMVPEVNAALNWVAGAMVDTKGYKDAAATSASNASTSASNAASSADAATYNGSTQVNLAKDQVQLAKDQVDLAQQKVSAATTQANNAAASAATATTMAQAAGAAVGPTPVPNKFLGTDSAGNVAWRDAGQKIGDALFTARAPDATYLPLNGGVYSQTAYAALFGIVGLISGSFAEVWAAVTSNAGSNAINAVETDGNGVWVAAGAAGAMVRSTDNGVPWTAVTSGFGADAINGLACDRASVWVAVGASGKVSRSANNGATWAIVTSGLVGSDTLYSVTCDRNSTFVATYAGGVLLGALRSTNKGAAWAAVTINNTASVQSGHKAVATDRKGVWLATSFSRDYFRSTDDGATWTIITGVTGASTSRLTTDGKGTWFAARSALGATVVRSFDNGLTWSAGSSFPVSLTSQAIATDSNGTWIVGDSAERFARSTDNGSTWAITTVTGLTGGALSACFGKDGVVIAGAASGVLQRSTPTFGYDTATQFKLPNQPAAIGLAAYIKAKDA